MHRAPLFTGALLLAVSPLFGAPARTIEDLEIALLPKPAFERSGAAEKASPFSLVQVSARPNEITDDEAWFERNGLELPVFEVPNPSMGQSGNLPAGIPPKYLGNLLVKAIHGSDSTLLLYGPDFTGGRFLIAMDSKTGAFKYGYDFANFAFPPGQKETEDSLAEQRLQWAVEKGGVLYVSHAHPGYAKDSGGKNAYLTALDVKDGKVLWRSHPLVSNAATFAVLDAGIVSGYGFTAEPDFLYLIDRKDGAVLAKAKLKSGPAFILPKDGKLHVRCYDTDAVFEVRRK